MSNGRTVNGRAGTSNVVTSSIGAANGALRFEASRIGAGTASASLLSLTGSELNLNPGGGTRFTLDAAGTGLVAVIVPAPEPATVLLVTAAGLAGYIRACRRPGRASGRSRSGPG